MSSRLPIGPPQQLLIAISVVGAAIPALAVILRLLARRVSHRALNSSDYLIIPACIIAVGYQVALITSVYTLGTSYHMTELIDAYGPDKIIEFSIYLFCTQPVYTASITLTKLSILELYRSIFPTTKMLVACRATQAIVILWGLATMLVTFLLCRPLAYNWDTTIPGGSCGDTLASWESTGISNIITDVIVLVLPIYDLSKIQMAAYKKAVLIAVFALGVFTTAVGIARLIAIIHVDFTDITSGAAWAIEYSALECSVAVTLSCIPLLRPLLGRSTYSSGGTARAPSTWRGTVLTIGRMQKPLFRVSSDNFSQLELHPVGPV